MSDNGVTRRLNSADFERLQATIAAKDEEVDKIEDICCNVTAILCGENVGGNTPIEIMARKANKTIAEQKAVIERLEKICGWYDSATACHPHLHYPYDQALTNKEKE